MNREKVNIILKKLFIEIIAFIVALILSLGMVVGIYYVFLNSNVDTIDTQINNKHQ